MERTVSAVVARTYEVHVEHLLQHLCAQGATRATAEDLVHEAFARAIEQDDFEDEAHCIRWLQVVARNLHTDLRRGADHRYAAGDLPQVLVDEADLDPSDLICRKDTGSQVRHILERLSSREAALLWERHALDRPVAQVAEATGVTVQSASVLLTRARRRFSENWRAGRSALLVPWARAVRTARRTLGLTGGYPVYGPALVAGILGVGALVNGTSMPTSLNPDVEQTPAGALAVTAEEDPRDGQPLRQESRAPGVNQEQETSPAPIAAPVPGVALTRNDRPSDNTSVGLRVRVKAAGHDQESDTAVHSPAGGGGCVTVVVGQEPQAHTDRCD